MNGSDKNFFLNQLLFIINKNKLKYLINQLFFYFDIFSSI